MYGTSSLFLIRVRLLLLAGCLWGNRAWSQTPAATPPSQPRVAPAAPSPPAPVPSPAAPSPAVAPAPSRPAARSPTPVARTRDFATDPRQGIVRLERDGQRIGFGAVLRGDGRIITALSALGHGNHVKARFADGSVLAVHVVRTDRPADLALLESAGGHWTRGLKPSVIEPNADGTALLRFRGRGSRLEEAPFALASRRALLGRDGVVLENMLIPSASLPGDELGSPVFDEGGDVVAVVVQACSPNVTRTCQLEPYGAPISALRAFLRTAPPRAPLPSSLVGLKGVAGHQGSVAGVRLVAVEPGTPASAAGLRADDARSAAGGESGEAGGDLVVAIDDVPVTTPEALSEAINRVALAPPAAPPTTAAPAPPPAASPSPAGRHVRLLVYGSGKFREVVLELKPPLELPKP